MLQNQSWFPAWSTPWSEKAPAGLTRLLLADIWNSRSVNLSHAPHEPWTISWCTWVLPQARCICKVCQLCGSLIQIRPISKPSHSSPPYCPTPTPKMSSFTPPSSWAPYTNLNLSHCTSVQHGCCLAYDLPTDCVPHWGQYTRIMLKVMDDVSLI